MYSNPSTQTNSFAPGAEIIFVGSFKKNDSAKVETCFLAGVTFTHTTQVYNVLWNYSNSNQIARDNFFTNEFLFNMGGMMKFKISEGVSLNVGLGIQIGPNYTWTDDPYGSVTMSRIIGVNDPNWQVTLANNYTGQSNRGIWRTTPYKWEYFQFYAFGSAQMSIKITEKISLLIGIKPRVFFYENDLSEEVPMKSFNYAALKVYTNAGLQLKIFK